MPTGYTCFIEDGRVKDAKQFLHLCLNAFGILSRDHGLEVMEDYKPEIIKEYKKEKKFHKTRLKAAQLKLEKIRHLTDDELYQRYQKEKESYMQKIYENQMQSNENYNRIYESIRDWDCDPELYPLKEFALNQIEISHDSVDVKPFVPISKDEFLVKVKEGFLEELIKDAEWDIDYHQKELNRLEENYDSRIAYYEKVKKEFNKLK